MKKFILSVLLILVLVTTLDGMRTEKARQPPRSDQTGWL